MVKAKVGDPKIEAQALEEMRKINKAVTVAYLERKCGIPYMTMRAILMEMESKGLIGIIRSTGNPIFVLPDWTPDFLTTGKNEKKSEENDSDSKNIE
jgi:hypothetical protein